MTEICKRCEKALNGVNGRYCMELKMNVEWMKKTPCENEGGENQILAAINETRKVGRVVEGNGLLSGVSHCNR